MPICTYIQAYILNHFQCQNCSKISLLNNLVDQCLEPQVESGFQGFLGRKCKKMLVFYDSSMSGQSAGSLTIAFSAENWQSFFLLLETTNTKKLWPNQKLLLLAGLCESCKTLDLIDKSPRIDFNLSNTKKKYSNEFEFQ